MRFDGHIKARPAPIENYSGIGKHFSHKSVKVLKRHQYRVKPDPISGDAPKDFIRIYEYGRCRKSNPKNWVGYIAKIGHKWYPVESITEHLLTRLGQEWGFNMANSKLYVIAGQVRFCSEFFRKRDQELVHGADILSRYLQEADTNMIEQIDRLGWSQEMLSLQFVRGAINEVFPEQSEKICQQLVELLLFDAIVGNNDRHFFNWGIIRNLKGLHDPYFSPIYDTARGLFWNHAEQNLLSLRKDKNQLSAFFVKYNKNSRPKIGWEGDKAINHFQMVERLVVHNDCGFDKARSLFAEDNVAKAHKILNTEFKGMLSEARIDLILRYLEYRFKEFSKLLNT